jgi:pyruvate dehydrogenase E2 component (dihydrolipoamide acetyltransferase)
MEEGTILKWLAAEGDTVTLESVLFELETDKTVIEVPSPSDGVLLKILTDAGPVRVEQVVAWIGAAGERIEVAGAAVPKAPLVRHTAASAAPMLGSRSGAPSTPAARRRAAELGIDISTVTGSGPGGRITQEDVERKAQES